MPRDWDAEAYDRLPIPMTEWGHAVIERLTLRGDERVLDAGCGTGQVTAFLLERLPRGRVIAVDGSASMVERARERLGEDRIEYHVADLLDPLPVTDLVDAIVSTATFHWITDHGRLFRNLANSMTSGGRLEAQCGGAGNIAAVVTAVRSLGVNGEAGKRYATPEQTSALLEDAGFDEIRCWLEERPTPLSPADLEPYLRAICLGGVIDEMPEIERDRFVRSVAARLPTPTIDYVRLNISARRR
ncbi:MAG TPA: methyltransferase domain-containing protein [Actinomycetota bacterium]|nr:methyltransferase domain-containing protein [Actinomycetota bacterium]